MAAKARLNSYEKKKNADIVFTDAEWEEHTINKVPYREKTVTVTFTYKKGRKLKFTTGGRESIANSSGLGKPDCSGAYIEYTVLYFIFNMSGGLLLV